MLASSISQGSGVVSGGFVQGPHMAYSLASDVKWFAFVNPVG